MSLVLNSVWAKSPIPQRDVKNVAVVKKLATAKKKKKKQKAKVLKKIKNAAIKKNGKLKKVVGNKVQAAGNFAKASPAKKLDTIKSKFRGGKSGGSTSSSSIEPLTAGLIVGAGAIATVLLTNGKKSTSSSDKNVTSSVSSNSGGNLAGRPLRPEDLPELAKPTPLSKTAPQGNYCGQDAKAPANPFNQRLLSAVAKMPKGGGYSTASAAWQRMLDPNKPGLSLDPAKAAKGGSSCSDGTYAATLLTLQESPNPPSTELSLALTRPNKDGVGLWGYWNANGPGTATLVQQLGLGHNFEDSFLNPAKGATVSEAQPGDYLKIIRNQNAGPQENGHSVIFMGYQCDAQGKPKSVCYWSSQQSTDGFGEQCEDLQKVKMAIFSRITQPEALEKAVPKSQELDSDFLKTTLAKGGPGASFDVLRTKLKLRPQDEGTFDGRAIAAIGSTPKH